MLHRRSLLQGLFAAPAIVRFNSLMPVKVLPEVSPEEWLWSVTVDAEGVTWTWHRYLPLVQIKTEGTPIDVWETRLVGSEWKPVSLNQCFREIA